MRALHARRIHIAFALAASLSLAGFQEETEIARWIDDLGHDEIARRDQAQTQLLKAGMKALAALKKAADSKDREKAARVAVIIAEIERPEREKEHDARQRAQRLRLVTLEFPDGKLSDVLAAIGKALDYKVVSKVDPDLRVRIVGKDLPLRQVLDTLESQLDISIVERSYVSVEPRSVKGVTGATLEATKGRPTRGPRVHTRGATFHFNTKAWRVDDKIAGWILETLESGSSYGSIERIDVKGADGQSRAIEQCGRCSPGLILIRSEKAEEFRVLVRGNVKWVSAYEFQLSNPEVPQDFKVGPFTAHYEFPLVRITSSTPTDPRLFAIASLDGKIKAGRGKEGPRMGGRFAGRDKPPKGWCKCEKGPQPFASASVEAISEYVHTESRYQNLAASDFESMNVNLFKYLQEPFDGETVIPAE
jgi:hypothetical protein